MHENNAELSDVSFLKFITVMNPDGSLLTQSAYAAELSSRNVKPSGETMATSYGLYVKNEISHDSELLLAA